MGTPAALSPSHIEQQVLEIVRDLLHDLGREHAASRVSLDAALERDLGIASLDLVELMVRCESRFDVELSETIAERATTPAAWARAILEAEPAAGARSSYVIRQPRRSPPPAPTAAATFVDVLRQHAEFDADRAHIHLLEKNAGREITYGQLLSAASQTAAGLQASGLRRGETVAIMLPTSPEFFTAFFGVLLAGGAAVPIFPPANPQQIEEYVLRQVRVLRHADIRFLITFDRVKTVSRLMRLRLSSPAEVVTVAALREAGTGVRLRPVEPAHYALVQYTSGSTGDPKGVALTHGNLLANVRAIGDAVRVRPGDAVVSWMPLYSDLGLVGTWLFSLYHAAPITVISPLDFIQRPERWLRAIHDSRGTLSAGPNFGYELCARKAPAWALENVDLSCWRVAVNAGEAVLPATLDRFTERFAPFGFRREAFVAAYGLAENTVALSIPEIGRAPRIDAIDRDVFERTGRAQPTAGHSALQYVSSGRPLPGHEALIVDEHGQPPPERVQGRLVFRGPSCTAGYFRNPESTAAAMLPDGWMDSGDLAYFADGEIFFTGRRKECIIHEGRSLSPQDLEVAAGTVSGVRPGSAVAFGVPDPVSGTERIVIAAETLARNPADVARVKAAVERKLADALELRVEVELTAPGAVPRTANGKIRRGAVRALYLEGKLRARRRPLWKQIASLWRGALGYGMLRAGRGAMRVAKAAAASAFEAAVCAGIGLAARAGMRRAAKSAAALLHPVNGARFATPGLYVANRVSATDVWAMLAASRGETVLAGDAALLGMSGAARWALVPLVVRDPDVFARRRSVVLLPDSPVDAPAVRCRYRIEMFQAALASGAPVIPVALQRNGKGLSVTAGPVLNHAGVTDAAELRNRTRAAIAQLLEGGVND
jgi:acyl carrier protein